MVRANGVDLCVETFGDPGDPAVLLVAGAASSMDWWETGFCERLAKGGRFVIRYDLRDTGRSVTSPPGAPSYRFDDLVDDAVGLLDALGIARAHLVGISMGGGIVQQAVVLHPDRVVSVTLVATSPGGPGNDENGLPPIADRLLASFADPPPVPDWSDRDAVIDHLVEGVRRFSGSLPFDEARVRAVAARMVDRTTDVEASQTNHWILEGGTDVRSRLGEITVPALVLHGTEDPLFPLGHGEAFTREIPGARLVPLDGVGHEAPPRSSWDLVVPAILEHTA
jgi:pimeloyl-ACP methyl ester carboxylesterase